MRNEETLLDVAEANYKIAQILQGYGQDPTNICYHLQQAVEFAIKHFLEKGGIECGEFSHGITQLTLLAEENHIDIHLSEYISEHPKMFISWYVKEPRSTSGQIETAMTEIGKYLDICRRAYEQELEQTGKEPEEEIDEKDEI